MEQLRWLGIIAVTWLIAVGLGAVVPQLVQQAIVEPNELQRESQYIANNIALTRTGFGLDGVDSRSISGQGEPPASALQADSPVLRNVRLWDYRIARETFQQCDLLCRITSLTMSTLIATPKKMSCNRF